jgi:hypothetical protein
MYAMIAEALDLQPGHKFLNVGSGTGYFSAIVAHLLVGARLGLSAPQGSHVSMYFRRNGGRVQPASTTAVMFVPATLNLPAKGLIASLRRHVRGFCCNAPARRTIRAPGRLVEGQGYGLLRADPSGPFLLASLAFTSAAFAPRVQSALPRSSSATETCYASTSGATFNTIAFTSGHTVRASVSTSSFLSWPLEACS